MPVRASLRRHPHIRRRHLELDRLGSARQLDAYAQQLPASDADLAPILDDRRNDVPPAERQRDASANNGSLVLRRPTHAGSVS